MAQPPQGDPSAQDANEEPAADVPTIAWQTPERAADPIEPPSEQPANPLISWSPSGDAPADGDPEPGPATIGSGTTQLRQQPSDDRRTVPVAGFVAAGTAGRVIAYLIDGLVLLAINVVLTLISDPSAYDFDPAVVPAAASSTSVLLTKIIAIGIEYAYFVGLWTSRGRATLGMRLLRIQVIDATADRPLRLVPASARWFLLSGAIALVGLLPVATDFFGLVSLIWVLVLFGSVVANPLRQGIHDQAANSLVVQRTGVRSNTLIVGCVVLLILFVVLPLVSLALVGSQLDEILREVGQSI